jgi:hypothetical protein
MDEKTEAEFEQLAKDKLLKLSEMSKEEKSLLLFFETCAVNASGLVNSIHMNQKDFQIATKWKESGFIHFGRIPSKELQKNNPNHWVVLSEEAFLLALLERKARAKRNPCKYYEPKTN